eukprot:CAMPEP_0176101984 /NCGR_PEP_ID=MMETSP0120_2-20121206/51152_1 /TAXON_ID=160619 /ORGANISM="Kryptoperidinium foliaceum, Strain CCMP 1326" /LENGTH=291 /DNA_ID=CAMNT_0017436037 /DNA_START=1 /DNA_END=873 /DNA_ORIENTATION=+
MDPGEEAAAGSAPAAASAEDAERSLCRYCFEPGEDGKDLVAPCACVGGQRWVHTACLRHWQRSVLASQPTRMANEGDDARATRCSVCLQPFSLSPPSRFQVLVDAVGPAIADLLRPGSLLLTSPMAALGLEAAVRSRRRTIQDFVHWCNAAYLLHDVGPWRTFLAVPDEGSRVAASMLVDDDGRIVLNGRRFRLLGSPDDMGSPIWGQAPGLDLAADHVGQALADLEGALLPARLRLEAVDRDEHGSEDTILGVNLSRPISAADLSPASTDALRLASATAAAQLDVAHRLR